jgi:hypothetical protein
LKYETENRFQLTTTLYTFFPDFLFFHSTLAARDGQKRKHFHFVRFRRVARQAARQQRTADAAVGGNGH